jgi:hypothetical protein
MTADHEAEFYAFMAGHPDLIDVGQGHTIRPEDPSQVVLLPDGRAAIIICTDPSDMDKMHQALLHMEHHECPPSEAIIKQLNDYVASVIKRDAEKYPAVTGKPLEAKVHDDRGPSDG